MSGQRKRRQLAKRQAARQHRGPRSAIFHGKSHCVRTGDGYHALICLDPTRAIAVRPGQRAHITSQALPGVSLPGQVLTVAPTSAERYLVTVAVTGTHAKLGHGLPVDVSITTRTMTDVLVVPNTAVIRTGDMFFVDVLEPDGTRRRVPFTPGLIGRDSTEGLDGLTEGQEVILNRPEPGQCS